MEGEEAGEGDAGVAGVGVGEAGGGETGGEAAVGGGVVGEAGVGEAAEGEEGVEVAWDALNAWGLEGVVELGGLPKYPDSTRSCNRTCISN